MATWYFICKIDSKSPHTFGKQLNCSWPPRQFPSLSTARLVREKTDVFHGGIFRHAVQARKWRHYGSQTFNHEHNLKTLTFVVVVFSITFLEFQFSKLIRNNPPWLKATFKNKQNEKGNRPLSDFSFHMPTRSPCNTNLRPQMFCYQVNTGGAS